MDDKKVNFLQMPGTLYARNPEDNNNEGTNENHNMLKDTQQSYLAVKDNYKFLSNRQIKKDQEVKRLQIALGIPLNTDLKTIITINTIQNNQITHKDFNLAERTSGNPIGIIKGKNIRRYETFNKNNLIEIPEELTYKNKDLELSIDTMYVYAMIFLTLISHDIYYRTSQDLPQKNKNNYIKCMEEILTR